MRDRSFLELAVLISGTMLLTPCALAQEQGLERDIPSIAPQALKSVVVVETKDGQGKPLAQGSGFVVSSDGKVVTNFHVIQGATSAEIRFPNGASYFVEGMVASNPDRDLVIFKIKTTSTDFQFLSLGDSDRVAVGEQVVAVGSPLGVHS